MNQTVHHCLTRDDRYAPPRLELIHQANTEREAIEYLENNGGGVYRNILHNFDCRIEPKEGA